MLRTTLFIPHHGSGRKLIAMLASASSPSTGSFQRLSSLHSVK
jgi:hypothetical protein